MFPFRREKASEGHMGAVGERGGVPYCTTRGDLRGTRYKGPLCEWKSKESPTVCGCASACHFYKLLCCAWVSAVCWGHRRLTWGRAILSLSLDTDNFMTPPVTAANLTTTAPEESVGTAAACTSYRVTSVCCRRTEWPSLSFTLKSLLPQLSVLKWSFETFFRIQICKTNFF